MTHWKSTILFLLLAAIGVAAMLRTMRHDALPHERSTAGGRLLSSSQLPVDDLTRITVVRPGASAMVFERTGSDWNMVEPFAFPMDPFSIRQIAVAARELEAVDAIEPANLGGGQTLATLSLDPPAAEVTYEWPRGKTTVQLGRQSVAGRAYLRLAGVPAVQVVNQKLHERILGMDPKEWRDRAIFHNVGIDSNLIDWQQGNSKLVLARDRKTWKMLEPAATRVDPVGRDAYMLDLGRAQVSGFIQDQPSADDLVKFGLTEPVAVLSITTGDQTQRLLIGARVGANSVERYAMIEGRPVVVKLSGQAIGALVRQPQDLAAATGSGAVPADVKSMVIRSGGQELRLERNLDKWTAPGRENTPVEAAQVQELLDQLTQLRASAVELRPYPRELEIATITLYGFDAKAIDTIRIAKEPDAAGGAESAGKIAMENGDNVLRLFPSSLKLRLTAKDFGLP